MDTLNSKKGGETMNTGMMWVLVVIALVVGLFGGYMYEKSKLTNQMMMTESSMQKQVTDLQMKNDELMKNQSTGSGTMMHVTPTGMMQH